MKQLVVLSGKGGTGKTTVTAALADLASRENWVTLVDADVDASNLELLLAPRKRETHEFSGSEHAVVDANACRGSGQCAQACRFEAVIPGKPTRIDPVACDGCRACLHRCPHGAIRMVPARTGSWFRSETRFGPLFHAELAAGRENSGRLVSEVRRAGVRWARETGCDLILIDGPPGMGCPVIASSAGVDLALIVTEPTLSAIEDSRRALDTTRHFGIPSLVCINKFDLNRALSARIEATCIDEGLPVVGRLPFDLSVVRAMAIGLPATMCDRSEVSRAIEQLWRELEHHLHGHRRDNRLAV